MSTQVATYVRARETYPGINEMSYPLINAGQVYRITHRMQRHDGAVLKLEGVPGLWSAKAFESVSPEEHLELWKRDNPVTRPVGEWIPFTDTFLNDPVAATCSRCGRSTWSQTDRGGVDLMRQPDGGVCGGVFQ